MKIADETSYNVDYDITLLNNGVIYLFDQLSNEIN